ncbi:MAG: 7,8-didemethyl-8-hydroxy-5-deazariboflavin synthase subunit CofG [Leptolyngbyaceae cyanobacterium bins.349]|nr:7,8-didemethyl-8-hydroxy-5-deazariboflavin synthase subunit CofG [Leptolyngbyaceae cyanobacterium bins.349]
MMTAPRNLVTYSPAYTLVPTYECFNRCVYCNFRVDPGQDRWLTLAEAEARLRSLPVANPLPVIEILILSGEVHPQSARREEWLERIYQLCDLALSLGFLPHANVGPLSRGEMARLKTVNVSMGLMLEQLTPTLRETVHRHAPSKDPQLRLQQLEWAGELQIPFTTGLLLGIGETDEDRRATLAAIAQLHTQFGHIQEVILQPYSPGSSEVWSGAALSPTELVDWVAIARQILPDDITLQVPPNLIQNFPMLIACLEAGASDLGGISPHDEVNPDYPHPSSSDLKAQLAIADWQLVPRLPVYRHYNSWLEGRLGEAVQRWQDAISPQVID